MAPRICIPPAFMISRRRKNVGELAVAVRVALIRLLRHYTEIAVIAILN
ncbi:MAG: hypothetical protein K2N25_02700 [Muribaculaceae bacterium]|nr:hypothetical protein [Muribaculaceae bacterium]